MVPSHLGSIAVPDPKVDEGNPEAFVQGSDLREQLNGTREGWGTGEEESACGCLREERMEGKIKRNVHTNCTTYR